eukprot:GHVR01064160.1.p1 GENE.GHVR01064160.1~~GHVR01064160.1.p1  ORF type:complete len:160 (+),score=11.18 GHVR01064160.1:78-557(+)
MICRATQSTYSLRIAYYSGIWEVAVNLHLKQQKEKMMLVELNRCGRTSAERCGKNSYRAKRTREASTPPEWSTPPQASTSPEPSCAPIHSVDIGTHKDVERASTNRVDDLCCLSPLQSVSNSHEADLTAPIKESTQVKNEILENEILNKRQHQGIHGGA